MKKILMLIKSLLFFSILLSQNNEIIQDSIEDNKSIYIKRITIYNSFWTNFNNELIHDKNTFTFNVNDNGDLFWYNSEDYKSVFKRIEDDRTEVNRLGELCKITNYEDNDKNRIIVIYYYLTDYLRIYYPELNLMIDFFNY
jgi:hypothetical protein